MKHEHLDQLKIDLEKYRGVLSQPDRSPRNAIQLISVAVAVADDAIDALEDHISELRMLEREIARKRIEKLSDSEAEQQGFEDGKASAEQTFNYQKEISVMPFSRKPDSLRLLNTIRNIVYERELFTYFKPGDIYAAAKHKGFLLVMEEKLKELETGVKND